MWQLLKLEIKYNRTYFLMLVIGIIFFTLFFNYYQQYKYSPGFELDYLGGLFNIILYTFFISVWGIRLKEKRIRYGSLLPIPQKQNSLFRFWFAAFPFIVVITYLILLQFIMINNWHKEIDSLLRQIGVALILFAGFIRGRDDWFSYWNFGKRTRRAFVSVLIIQVAVVFAFLEMKNLNKELMDVFRNDAINFATLIFTLLGFIILITTIFSFRKRRTYLA